MIECIIIPRWVFIPTGIAISYIGFWMTDELSKDWKPMGFPFALGGAGMTAITVFVYIAEFWESLNICIGISP